MRFLFLLLIGILTFSCSNKTEKVVQTVANKWSEEKQLEINETHVSPRMRYKLIQSKFVSKSDKWKYATKDMVGFTESDYLRLKSLIYEQDIPTIRRYIQEGKLTYENLVKWYIYRIVKYESNPETTLHSIICLNENAIKIGRYRDANKSENDHPIYGMPILLKDNINTSGCTTTAGAILLAENQTNDATIVSNLKKKGAIILGKVNLSEWAYYFCDGCPLGYSAIGGQTLNPYGRFMFETGGSSAGSGVTMAANYAVAAVGTETAGSILSPSSQNSIVGLKPTIGLLSRTGIVPISSTLDTPGPMTRSIVDNAILLSAMIGKDDKDPITHLAPENIDFLSNLDDLDINTLRFGVNTNFLEIDSLYKKTVGMLKMKGATIVEFTPGDISLDGFVDILNYDMQRDLPAYFENEIGAEIGKMSIADVIEFNNQDSLLRAPYGQGRLIASRDDRTSGSTMDSIKSRLEEITRKYYDLQFHTHNLDAILSINNYDAAYAAVAKYPCLAMPMGYTLNGEPKALTFIGKRFEEKKLFQAGRAFERAFDLRRAPNGY